MIVKPALAAMLASGLVAPETPKLVFPKPAIVKSENLDFSKHMLLGMPLTLGMLPRKFVVPVGPTYLSTATYGVTSSLATISWTHNVESYATCLIVVLGWSSTLGATGNITVTANSTSMTKVTTGTRCFIFRLFSPPTGSVTITATSTDSLDRHFAGHSATFSGVTSVQANNAASTGNQVTSFSLTTTSNAILVVGHHSQREGFTSAYTITLNPPATNTQLQAVSNGINVSRRTHMWVTPVISPTTSTITTTSSLSDTQMASHDSAAIALVA